jgi:magnesium-protoporphyrin IX monomethyl ester (oxidative) cyclase
MSDSKRVALVFPGKDQRYAIQEPLNLGFIASYLEKHNIEVTIIDQLAGQDVEKEIEKFKPDIVGITGVTSVILDAYEIADMCRKKGILTVMGGVHVSLLPEEALKHADIVVKGEGEIAMLDIVKGNIKSGIISRPYIKNIDDVPPPARHLIQMEFYLYSKDRFPESWLCFVPSHTRVAELFTSRGCPHACIFCHNSWRGTPYRFNSAERVVSEIKDVMEKYNVRYLFFIDDNLFANRPRLKRICELIKENKLDIAWGGNSRVDTVDPEILKITKDAGCKQITFGFESGSQRILDVLNKRTTVEQAKKAIKMCKNEGLIVNGTFIIGNPTETVEDIKLTQKFIKENDVDYPGVGILTPYPGTEVWKMCERNNLIPKEFNWKDFTAQKVSIACNTTMPAEEIKRLLDETNDIILTKRILKHPLRTLKESIRHPSRITKTLKQGRKIKL